MEEERGLKKKAKATVKFENQFKVLKADEDEDEENYFIVNVEKARSWLQVGAGEITIDSVADGSVCPQSRCARRVWEGPCQLGWFRKRRR